MRLVAVALITERVADWNATDLKKEIKTEQENEKKLFFIIRKPFFRCRWWWWWLVGFFFRGKPTEQDISWICEYYGSLPFFSYFIVLLFRHIHCVMFVFLDEYKKILQFHLPLKDFILIARMDGDFFSSLFFLIFSSVLCFAMH